MATHKRAHITEVLDKNAGLWVSPTRFVSFAEKRQSAAIATRTRVAGAMAGGMGQWLPNPDPVLRKMGKNIQVYRDLRADAHVGGCVRRRKAAVLALEYGIDRENADSRVVEFVETMLAGWKLDRIISEILDATLYGYQPLEVVWDVVSGPDGKGRHVILDIEGKPAEWFGFDDENRLRFKDKDAGPEGIIVADEKVLVARQDASYDNPYGVADLSRCYWPTIFKRGGMEFWLKFTEKYGSPFLIGKHPRATPQDEADLLAFALENMQSTAVAVIPDDASVEILEAGGKGASADVFDRLLRWCRSEVSIALLGQDQTTEADTTNASAQAGLLVAEDIRDADKRMVESVINEAIGWVVGRNFDEDAPRFSMWEPQDLDKARAERDAILAGMPGGPVFTDEYLMREFGYEEGDLGERPAPTTGGFAPGGFPAFAEKDAVPAPDQTALDEAIDALAPEALQAQMETLLQPAIRAVRAAKSESEVLGLLAEAYPEMSEDDLIQTMQRLFFAADVWGRLSNQAGQR